MIFVIYKDESDTCGNSSYKLLGYCEFSSLKKAKKEFPDSIFGGYLVERLKIDSPEIIRSRYND